MSLRPALIFAFAEPLGQREGPWVYGLVYAELNIAQRLFDENGQTWRRYGGSGFGRGVRIERAPSAGRHQQPDRGKDLRRPRRAKRRASGGRRSGRPEGSRRRVDSQKGKCPGSFQEIQEKLRTVDVDGADCMPGSMSGVATRLVTNRSQLLGVGDDYRALVTRACGGRAAHELYMSVFGVRAADAQGELPSDIEVIGMQRVDPITGTARPDGTAGVFNFYAREEGTWKFFGSSEDFVSQGYDCNADGVCLPRAAKQSRCAACHPGGGLTMKELNSPWVNWEDSSKIVPSPNTSTPGAMALFVKHGPTLLGQQRDGQDMESQVTRGHRTGWVPRRINALKNGKFDNVVAELLRPLFCTIDLGIESTLSEVNANFFVNRRLHGDTVQVDFDKAEYSAALVRNNQLMMDGRNASCAGALARGELTNSSALLALKPPCTPLSKGKAVVRDTVLGFTFPQHTGADEFYVDQLLCRNLQVGEDIPNCTPLISDDFVKDVLAVDFTRPTFSSKRCDLLQFAPRLAASKISANAIRDGFKANLKGRTGAAAELLASLNDTNPNGHDARVDAYANACAARATKDPKAMTRDILAQASQLRNAMRRARVNLSPDPSKLQQGRGVIEFPETLPVDDLPADGLSFNPTTCLRDFR